MAKKDFREEFFRFFNKLDRGENFSFCRFTDGELYLLENRELILGPHPDHHEYKDEYDHKHFNPRHNQAQRLKLIESFLYDHASYYIGIYGATNESCLKVHRWMKQFSGRDEEHLTWADLLCNANYTLFQEYMVPHFSKRNLVIVCSRSADLSQAPFANAIVKDFRVGPNCIINDYYITQDVTTWVRENNIKNHVFLFACSSLGNFLCYELHKACQQNVYIDLGSTLNPFIGLNRDRGYLAASAGLNWRGVDVSKDIQREEVWDET